MILLPLCRITLPRFLSHRYIKLDGSNYYNWVIFMEMLFDGLNLLSHTKDSASSDEIKTPD